MKCVKVNNWQNLLSTLYKKLNIFMNYSKKTSKNLSL